MSGSRYDGSRFWCGHCQTWRIGGVTRYTRTGMRRVFCPVCGYMMRTRPKKPGRRAQPHRDALPSSGFALQVARALLEAKGREVTSSTLYGAALTVRRLGAQLLLALASAEGGDG